MGHDHGVVTAGGKHRARLAIALAIAAAVFLMELVGALVTGSLALLLPMPAMSSRTCSAWPSRW